MSKTVIIVLGTIVVLILACIGLAWAGWSVAKSVSAGPEEAVKMAAEVADFDLPEGYRAQYGVKALGITLSSYETSHPNSHLFIAQAGPNSGIDPDQVRKLAQEADQKPNKRGKESRMKVISEETLTVRGKPATLLVSEGTNSENLPYRDMTLLFEGKGGPAMAAISGPLSVWDEEASAAFIASIR